ncbi:alpha/beta hydrolase, partial [uncultured Cohaesibacter sp.]|uniref:alpha/beta hydrolase n=1 Tax=uncultured Cohaesibacter sp. TaxID=1002546 RepID=UPI0037488FEA
AICSGWKYSLMLVDAIYGLGAMVLFSLDPAIVDETNGKVIDPALDLNNPDNGFDENGSHYDEAFVSHFQQAVGMRNTRLIKTAQARLAALDNGTAPYADDEPLTIPGANFGFMNNKLYAQDTALLSHTKAAHPLVKLDGSVINQIIHSVRPASGKGAPSDSYWEGALKTTVKTFLGTYAIRTTPDFSYGEDDIKGVDWDSSYTTPISSVKHVHPPLLAMGMTGGWEYLAAELIHDHAVSSDKSIAFIEGVTHTYNTCKQCETTDGEYGDTLKTTYDYIDLWLSA